VTKEDLVEEAQVANLETLGELDVKRATKFFEESKTWKK
jgi:hypothetical protein